MNVIAKHRNTFLVWVKATSRLSYSHHSVVVSCWCIEATTNREKKQYS